MTDTPTGTGTAPPAPVIDIHTHAMPLPLLRALEREGRADLSRAGDRVLTLDPALCGLPAGAPVPLPPEQYAMDHRLALLDASGVDHHVVAAPPFLFASQATDDALALELARRSNDALAEFAAESGGRLHGLATVPVGHPGAAAELTRALDELGLVGATMGTFGAGRELDDPVNEDLWTVLAARRCFTLLHPSRVSERDRLADYHLVQLLGYPLETALAVSRLIFGGVLERHELTLCLAHGGGCAHAVGARLDLGWHRKPVARVVGSEPTEFLRRLLYDTAVFDVRTIARLVEDVTARNVLLGTDTPFDLMDDRPLETVRRIGLDAADEAAILGGNAAALLPGLGLGTGPATAAGGRSLPSPSHSIQSKG
ncbi:amidohydrolase family protein [Streptomyces aculeolatus]